MHRNKYLGMLEFNTSYLPFGIQITYRECTFTLTLAETFCLPVRYQISSTFFCQKESCTLCFPILIYVYISKYYHRLTNKLILSYIKMRNCQLPLIYLLLRKSCKMIYVFLIFDKHPKDVRSTKTKTKTKTKQRKRLRKTQVVMSLICRS